MDSILTKFFGDIIQVYTGTQTMNCQSTK